VTRFEEVIRLRPEHAEAHLNLRGLYANMGKLDLTEEEYEMAVQLKPNLAEAHYSLGLFYESHRKDIGRALGGPTGYTSSWAGMTSASSASWDRPGGEGKPCFKPSIFVSYAPQ
jgi:hypothetical protein